MKTGMSNNTPARILSSAALCILVLSSSGCLQHRASTADGYRIEDKWNVPMLVPIAVQATTSEKRQTVVIILPAGQSETKRQVRSDCTISGTIFSLDRSSGSNERSWVVRGPSVSGWETLSGEVDIHAQWNIFLRDLARIHDEGCFPSGISSQLIRSAIVEKIPVPASEIARFRYSDQEERLVDMVPGMEIRIQRLLSTGEASSPGSGSPPRILTLDYDVISPHGIGVRLKRSRGRQGKYAAPLGSRDMEFATLDQRFARFSVLRLFLEGIAQNESKSDAILVGTSDSTQLDAITNLLQQSDPMSCVDRPGTACIAFPPGSVSLFSTVWVNGHKTTCPFGVPLASLLYALPPTEQAKALESIRVMRLLISDRYAEIHLTRTLEGARELLILPGDRIEWKG
jgi:hypothetical protein